MRPRQWTIGFLASLSFHAGLFALASVFLATRDVPPADPVATTFDVMAMKVPQDTALERATKGEAVPEGREAGQRANGAPVLVTNARATDPQIDRMGALITSPGSVQAALPPVSPTANLAPSAPVHLEAVKEVAPTKNASLSVAYDLAIADLAPTVSFSSTQVFIPTSALPNRQSAQFAIQPEPVANSQPDFVPAAFFFDRSEATAPARLDTATVAEAEPEQIETSVLLAWTGDLSTDIREATLNSAAALRIDDPGSEGKGLRDALARDLTAIDCGRAQTEYDPETGAINLRGHVKSHSDRDALISALETGLQGTLPIRDRLRRLPAPQCEVLTRMADMALPQSVEQFTNPLVIGDDLHARVYAFNAGDRIRFELQGADYPGWVYLDYFDNEGRVLHLIPNQTIAPLQLAAQAPLVFGGGGPSDIARDKLELHVSPPFGEDIVVAIVSSDPLFDHTRPMVENAAEYLSAIETRVAELRMRSDDFRGEWVYLFVETLP